jgi:hypothetical protein
MWVVNESILGDASKSNLASNSYSLADNSVFLLRISSSEIPPSWNVAGHCQAVLDGNIIGLDQKILLGNRNFMDLDSLKSNQNPTFSTVRLLFTPLRWVQRVNYTLELSLWVE